MVEDKGRLRIAIPDGKLLGDVTGLFYASGLGFERPDRRYLVESVGERPIDLVIVRPKEVPSFVRDPDSLVTVGISGNDVFMEEGVEIDLEDLPVAEIVPNSTSWSMYIGYTDRLHRIALSEGRKVNIGDLTGSVATAYPNITKKYLDDNGIRDARVRHVGGKVESIQYFYPDCNFIFDIMDTGVTARENNVHVFQTLHHGAVQMFSDSRQLSGIQMGILNDLREKFEIARLRNKPFAFDFAAS